MVTYIDTKNHEDYFRLFAKAQEVLKQAARDNQLPEGITEDQLDIGTLNQYFAYLETLISLAPNENIRSYFMRLPLDEEFLEIDPNTRNIKIPASFTRNGVGVKGDESAEIVYFKVNRYFDNMDLASDNIRIVIQWEAKDKNKQTITGVSPNFGKDIETIPGSIIFGWPIYGEFTEAAGDIKFAVRFFSVGPKDENDVRSLTYSLATLPAQLQINETMSYDLLDATLREVEHGRMIIDRIKNVGIYDPSIPVPGIPEISTPLFVVGEGGDIHIVDLPTEGDDGVTLKVAARPKDFGAIQYTWRKYPYYPATGDYETNKSKSEEIRTGVDSGVYEEMTENLGSDIYYRETSNIEAAIKTYEPIVVSTYLASTAYVEGRGFQKVDGSYEKLYKRYSTVTVKETGIYTVDVGARYGTNSVVNEMAPGDGIKIPGPLKPIVTPVVDEYDDAVVVTPDGVTHVIIKDGAAALKVAGQSGEDAMNDPSVNGENPRVELTYAWKQNVHGTLQPISGQTVPESQVKVYLLGVNGHGHMPDNAAFDEVLENATYNQNHITLSQSGDQVILYATEGLRTYASTDPNQGEAEWIGIDIDTGTEDIAELTWNGYPITQTDVDDSTSVGLGNGHLIFWAKAADLEASARVIELGENLGVTIGLARELPAQVEYTFSDENKEMTITGLTSEDLDNIYCVEVTAKRNGISTTQASGNYRLTNAPAKPVLKRNVWDQTAGENKQIISDYLTEPEAISTYRTNRNGTYNKLSFSVEPIAHTDGIKYIWMRANIQNDLDSDWVTEDMPRLQVDIGDALGALFVDLEGDNDIPVEDRDFHMTTLEDLGEIIDGVDNGPVLPLTPETELGYYYCIVVNELNNHRVANVSPFYRVVDRG